MACPELSAMVQPGAVLSGIRWKLYEPVFLWDIDMLLCFAG